MLPPIPQGLVPVTVQQDPARPRPEVQPVTPSSESEANRQISLDDKHPSEQEQKNISRKMLKKMLACRRKSCLCRARKPWHVKVCW